MKKSIFFFILLSLNAWPMGAPVNPATPDAMVDSVRTLNQLGTQEDHPVQHPQDIQEEQYRKDRQREDIEYKRLKSRDHALNKSKDSVK